MKKPSLPSGRPPPPAPGHDRLPVFNNLPVNKLGIKCSLGKNSIFTTAYEEVTILHYRYSINTYERFCSILRIDLQQS